MRKGLALSFLLCLLVTTHAVAQDKGQTGIALGYPASLTLVWQPSDRLAIRPEFSFTKSSGESTSTLSGGAPATSDSWGVGVGASAQFFVKRWDDLRAYVSPRFQYSWTENESGGLLDTSGRSWQLAGSFGGQYSLGSRFAVFGETGVSYSHHRTTHSGTPVLGIINDSKTEGHSWGLRSAVGAVIFF